MSTYADPSDGRYDLGTLTGEVSPDGKVIILDAIGGDWQLKTISDALRHLTAMPKIFKHKYDGKMHVPLTWAIVTQIAKIAELKGFRWRPEPDLNQWILDEFTRRFTEHGDMKFDVSGLDRTPMPHQAGRAFVAALNERFFFADEMGAGKTASALLTLLELRAQGKDPFPAVIVCPAAVIDPWMEEIEAWGMDLNAVVYQGSKRRNLSTRYDVYVMSWDVFRLDMQQPKKPVLDIDGNPLKDDKGKLVTEPDKEALPALLQFFWDGGKVPTTVVYDEAHALCLRHDSLISTPSGPKKIHEIRKGDRVWGVNHATGQRVVTEVKEVGTSRLRETIRLGSLNLTPGHPVWVTDSSPACMWYASNYEDDFYLRPLSDLVREGSLPQPLGTKVLLERVQAEREDTAPGEDEGSSDMRYVRSDIRGVQVGGQEVLLPGLHRPIEVRADEVRSLQVGDGGPGSSSQEERGEGEEFRGDALVPGVRRESVQRPGSYRSRSRDEQETRIPGTYRGERGAYYPAGAVAEAARLGVHPRVLSAPGTAATGLPDELQGRSGVSSPETSDRARRELSSSEITTGSGPEEGREAGVTWVDGAEVLELGSPERRLWNLATGTGNYVADEILVHNCNVKTKQSIAARNFAKVVRFAYPLSGTPITKNVAGFWSALNVLDIRSFPDQERFKERYTDRFKTPYTEQEEGLSSVNGPEFHTLMQGSMGRVAKADIMKDLPPKRYSVRYVEIPPAHRAAYTEMEEDMLAHIPDTDEPLPAMSTLAQLTRLSQLASSACDVQVEIRLEENEASPNFGMEVPHYTVTAKEPSWKIDELMNLAHENEGEPLVVFSPSTQLIKLAGARAEREGFKTGYIVGGQSKTQRTATRKAFQNRELDLICCNTAAGGVGLTLTAADTLVFLSRPWSYTQSAQAEDRIHRRGQEREAQIIDIIAKNTIEDRVRTALKDKAKALSELVRDPRIVKEILGGL